MKLNQQPSLVSAVAYGCISSILFIALLALALIETSHAESVSDKYKTHAGTECEQTHNTGKSLELGLEGEPDNTTGTINGRIMLTLKIDLGRDAIESRRIDCRQTMLYEQDRMYMENERLKLELELLRRKVEGDPNAGQTAAQTTVTDGDDW